MSNSNFSITRHGQPLSLSLYTVLSGYRDGGGNGLGTISTKEGGLIMDCYKLFGFNFFIGDSNCFVGGDEITITAGCLCIIEVRRDCNVIVGDDSIIITEYDTKITVGKNCIVIQRWAEDGTNHIFQPPANATIRINSRGEKAGYTIIEEDVDEKDDEDEEIEMTLEEIKEKLNIKNLKIVC